MQAVILAGGLGTRLRPLTYEIPKVLVPVSGKPFLHYILGMLSGNGVSDVVICVGHLGDRIVESVRDGREFGCDVKYSFERELLDTGGAIKNAGELLQDEFLVLNGDTYHPIDYAELETFWDERKGSSDGLVVLYENTELIVPNNVTIDDHWTVLAYDKNGAEGSSYVDSGVQVFKRSVFEDVPEGTRVSLENDIYVRLVRERRLVSYVSELRYYDIGTLERVKLFEEYLGRNSRLRP